jgi:hypothetical protein
MARTAKRARPVATLTHSVKVEVYRPEFELLQSMRHLDPDRLARAPSAEIEVGYFKTECCRQLVRAVLHKGKVTKLALDPCPERVPVKVSPELAKLLDAARRKAMRTIKGRPQRLPMPVQTFMSNPAAVVINGDPIIWCFEICIYGYCLQCCLIRFPGDPYGRWSCGLSILARP